MAKKIPNKPLKQKKGKSTLAPVVAENKPVKGLGKNGALTIMYPTLKPVIVQPTGNQKIGPSIAQMLFGSTEPDK